MLIFKIDLPPTAQFSAKNLEWRTGGKPDAQTVSLSIAKEISARPVRIWSSSPLLSVASKETQPGTYELTVTPSTTKEAVSGSIHVEFDQRGAGAVMLPFRISK